MTKEEAKKILSGYVNACNEDDFLALEMFEYEEVIEAMTMGANALSKPSLPPDLDEAAEEYAKNDSYGEPDRVFTAALMGFKAGAEWMAGQGYIKEGVARPDDDEIWVNLKNTDIKDGDKVVVQIRKKQ